MSNIKSEPKETQKEPKEARLDLKEEPVEAQEESQAQERPIEPEAQNEGQNEGLQFKRKLGSHYDKMLFQKQIPPDCVKNVKISILATCLSGSFFCRERN